MGDPNKHENFFYDSDEDVAWGPITIREVKRNLKRSKNIPPNYRRQTLSFAPCPVQTNLEMYTVANSTNSSKEYLTANESLDSTNIQSSEKIPAPAPTTICTTTSNDNSSIDFVSVQNQIDSADCLGVIALSSDSEDYDENSHIDYTPIKSERFSRSQSKRFNSFSNLGDTVDEVICLSSSEDEPEPHTDKNESHVGIDDTSTDSFEHGPTPKVQDISNTSVKGLNYSLIRSTHLDSILLNENTEIELGKISAQTPGIHIIVKTPVKSSTNFNCNAMEEDISGDQISKTPIKCFKNSITESDSSGSKNHLTNWIESQGVDMSDDEVVVGSIEKQLNYSSNNFYHRDQGIADENEKLGTPKAAMQIPKINIIANTPIKGPDYDTINDSVIQVSSFHNHEKSELSNESEDGIAIDQEKSENGTLYKSSCDIIKNAALSEHLPVSLDTSMYESANVSQNENEYDYCEEINHTLSSKLEMDLSLKNAVKTYATPGDSSTSIEHGLSKINSTTNSFTNARNNSFTTSEFSDKRNDSTTSNKFHGTQNVSFSSSKFPVKENDSMTSNDRHGTENDSINSHEYLKSHDESKCDENSYMNDTLAEMERLLAEGFESDSDDSIEEIIDSTSCKSSKAVFGNSSIQNISRIPVPKSFSEDSRSNSSMTNEFKVPKFPPKVCKKTPVNTKSVVTRSSPLSLQNIVSPVRLYINNSPCAPLKQNNKPGSVKSQHSLDFVSESTSFIPKKRRNLMDSLPEVVYKPSQLVQKRFDDHIILPNNIRKLITERIVIKHEPRRRINPEESMFSVGDKLGMRDLSVIVSDDQNISVHTTKQGFNL